MNTRIDGWMINSHLPEWLTNFFIASREIACPHDNLTGELVSEQKWTYTILKRMYAFIPDVC